MNKPTLDFLMDHVTINLNVFSSLMKGGVVSEINSRFIVTVDGGRL